MCLGRATTFSGAGAVAKPIVIRQVWSSNLESEFHLIRSAIPDYPFVSMDTEFPGVVFHSVDPCHQNNRNPLNHYLLLKENVDATTLIQLGFTLTDSDGNLPEFGTESRYIWEFNFKDFDLMSDPHSVTSIELLRTQGVDFEKNREFGVDARLFGELLMGSALVCDDKVCWVTFHSGYDFGYVIRILTGKKLPEELKDFMVLLEVFFPVVYDVKYLIKFCNSLYGGLDQVALRLGMERDVGKGHQAGSDSLLTWRVFHRIRDTFFGGIDHEKHAGVLYGLEIIKDNNVLFFGSQWRHLKLFEVWEKIFSNPWCQRTTPKKEFRCVLLELTDLEQKVDHWMLGLLDIEKS
ncbi:putative CCR4-associated factor 1 homolog 11 [Drosera capensis]